MNPKTDITITIKLKDLNFDHADDVEAFRFDFIGTVEGLFLKQGLDFDYEKLDFTFDVTASENRD